MYKDHIIDVIIPAFNEELGVGKVLDDLPEGILRQVVVVDNNSTDRTSDVARAHGAVVLHEAMQGYGAACLNGLAYLAQGQQVPDIVVFMDADHADHGEELISLLDPIVDGRADLVIGSRTLGTTEKGALMPQQILGNRLATAMLRVMYG